MIPKSGPPVFGKDHAPATSDVSKGLGNKGATTMATAKSKDKARPRAKQAVRKTSSARRAVRAKAGLKTAKPRKQTFVASHFDERDFKQQGLRRYAKYRDLGIAAATNGLAQAHVIRLIPPCDPAE